MPTGAFFAFFFIILLLIGGAVVWGAIQGAQKVARSQELRTVGRETTGTVVDNQMESHSHHHNGHHHSRLTFRPVIRYHGPNGEVTAIGPADSSRSFVVGTTVPIRYHPDKPDQIEIVSGQGRGSGGVGGIVAGVVGVIVLVLMATFACSVKQGFDDFGNGVDHSTPGFGDSGFDPFRGGDGCTVDGNRVVCE